MNKDKDKKKSDIIVGKYYKLICKLGKGAFGEIYKCKHMKEEKEYAVKLETRKNRYP